MRETAVTSNARISNLKKFNLELISNLVGVCGVRVWGGVVKGVCCRVGDGGEVCVGGEGTWL